MPKDNITRGTTPTLTFTLPFPTEDVVVAHVAFGQKGEVVLEKEMGADGCECKDGKIIVVLTQEETLRLQPCCNVDIQIRLKTEYGDVLASRPITTFIEDVIQDEVI